MERRAIATQALRGRARDLVMRIIPDEITARETALKKLLASPTADYVRMVEIRAEIGSLTAEREAVAAFWYDFGRYDTAFLKGTRIEAEALALDNPQQGLAA